MTEPSRTPRLSNLPRLGASGRTRLEDAARRDGSAFLVEGRKQVADVISRGQVPVRELWIADDLLLEDVEALLVAASSRNIPVGVAPAKDLDRVADTVTPQGVLAVADDPAWSVADLVRGARRPLLLLDGVQDPGNVGAILRVAAAFGASGVLIAEGTADPLGAKALRASAGTALTIPFARGSAAACRDAIEAGKLLLWLLDGGTPGEKGVSSLFDLTAPAEVFVLAVGSEGQGASAVISAASRLKVSIPISPAVESLNAAVAVGIAAAQLLRPRARTSAPSRDTRPVKRERRPWADRGPNSGGGPRPERSSRPRSDGPSGRPGADRRPNPGAGPGPRPGSDGRGPRDGRGGRP